jgi:hypothetical protein
MTYLTKIVGYPLEARLHLRNPIILINLRSVFPIREILQSVENP